eukprot:90302_1
MEEPENILEKIMKFEEIYTPQFNNLIKQSLIEHVTLNDEDDHLYANTSPTPNANVIPTITNNKSKNEEYEPDLPKPHLLSSLSHPVPMPSHKTKPTHQHKSTPIFKRDNNPKKVELIDPNNFIANLPSDLIYDSDEEEDSNTPSHKSSGSGSVQYHLSDYDDGDLNDDDDEEEQDPLIIEYDDVSHQIHVSKLKLRKLDRKMTM